MHNSSFAAKGSVASPTKGQPQPSRPAQRKLAEPDRVYELLRDDLTAGLFAPGEPLVELALAERYSASRTPVRTAIDRLINDRLVEARPHSVSLVRDITARDIQQIYEVRQALEGFAVEAAVDIIDRAKLERLLDFYAPSSATESVLDGPDADEGVEALHFLIAESLGNGRLTDILFTTSLPLVRMHALFWRLALPRVDALAKKRRAAALQEHRDIVEAILAGSGTDARAAVVRHLQGASDHLISLMSSVDLNGLRSLSQTRGERAATALDHMIPGVPSPEKETGA